MYCTYHDPCIFFCRLLFSSFPFSIALLILLSYSRILAGEGAQSERLRVSTRNLCLKGSAPPLAVHANHFAGSAPRWDASAKGTRKCGIHDAYILVNSNPK